MHFWMLNLFLTILSRLGIKKWTKMIKITEFLIKLLPLKTEHCQLLPLEDERMALPDSTHPWAYEKCSLTPVIYHEGQNYL